MQANGRAGTISCGHGGSADEEIERFVRNLSPDGF